MIEHDAFEGRLVRAIREYAAEAPPEPEALAFARIVIAGSRHDAGSAARDGARRWAAVAALVAAALVLASILALALSATGRRNELSIDLDRVPIALTGQFQFQVARMDPDGGVSYPWFLVDLTGPALIHGPTDVGGPDDLWASPGDVPGWSGRAVGFVPAGSGRGELRLDGGVCGPARYRVTYDDAELRFAPIHDACAERANVLTDKAWTHMVVPIETAKRHPSWSFGEPFAFELPDALGSAYAWTWLGPNRLRIGMIYWKGLFVDDEPLYVDMCDPAKGTLSDVPGTPDAVGAWLRSNGVLRVPDPVAIEVDGREGLMFEATVECPNGASASAGPRVPAGRIYAIPTGDDVVLYVTWSDGGVPGFDTASDELVRSITFD